MRVLLWMTGGSENIPGGHRIQLEQTAKHLIELGVDAEISHAAAPDLSKYDVIHGFELGVAEMRKCRNQQRPVALSTIYGSAAYITGQHYSSRSWATWKQRIRTALLLSQSAIKGKHAEKCSALLKSLYEKRVSFEMADVLLPNSQSEADAIIAELGVTTPYHVVPNAVDHLTFKMDEKISMGDKKGALCIGRFEPRKNQLGLINAMRGSDIPLTLVGPPHPHHAKYYKQCQEKATGNIRVLPQVPHDELPALYSKAKVHVLPSWIESPGLVSLEAALCGCNVATTNRGHIRDFFLDFAWYCDPAEPSSIRRAVEGAYHAPYQTGLRDYILDNFTWEHTAKATLEAYQNILGASARVSANTGTGAAESIGTGTRISTGTKSRVGVNF